ncbi:cytochrome P450 [Aspergillus spectabilis]
MTIPYYRQNRRCEPSCNSSIMGSIPVSRQTRQETIQRLSSRSKSLLGVLEPLNKSPSAREARCYDIFAYLNSLKGAGEGESLDRRQVLSESSVLVMAGTHQPPPPQFPSTHISTNKKTCQYTGYDTTATSLCAILSYLTRNPHTYTILSTEIRSRFKPTDPIFPRDLQDIPYLTACIDEAPRMSPSDVSCLFREVGSGGNTLDNHIIPPKPNRRWNIQPAP